MTTWALKKTFINDAAGPDAIISRIIAREVKTLEEELEALNDGWGIASEDYINDLIRSFGLSMAHGESYHTGMLIFKNYCSE